MPWWVIEDTELQRIMERCRAGEDVSLVYLEEYANCDHEYYDGEDPPDHGREMRVVSPPEDE